MRHRNKSLRAKLQAKGSRSVKRKLQRLAGRENRFANDVNHCISQAIVNHAERTNQAIVLEDLPDIRARTRACWREMRYRLHAWRFYDLQQKILYKARLAGIYLRRLSLATSHAILRAVVTESLDGTHEFF